MRFWAIGSGVENPIASSGNCPFNCGLCENHRTSTILANIDVTNRCNLSCPTCFADAGQSPEDPTMDQIRAMMKTLRDQRPVPCPAVQFSGGEPTIRDDLPEIISMAKEMGFAQIQVATNGVKLAASPRSLQKLGEKWTQHRLPAVRWRYSRTVQNDARTRSTANQASSHREPQRSRADEHSPCSNPGEGG